MKACHDSVIKEAICSDKKLKEAIEWLVSMHKQLTKSREQGIKVTKEAWVEIANLKESFHIKLANMRKYSHAMIHWL